MIVKNIQKPHRFLAPFLIICYGPTLKQHLLSLRTTLVTIDTYISSHILNNIMCPTSDSLVLDMIISCIVKLGFVCQTPSFCLFSLNRYSELAILCLSKYYSQLCITLYYDSVSLLFFLLNLIHIFEIYVVYFLFMLVYATIFQKLFIRLIFLQDKSC